MADGATILDVRLNARLPSVQRGDRYEDPLAYWIEGAFPGSRVTGGGTLRSPAGEPLSCAVRAEVVGDAGAIEDAVADFLDGLGAPLGSSLTVGERTAREFGVQSGFAVYLDGEGLRAGGLRRERRQRVHRRAARPHLRARHPAGLLGGTEHDGAVPLRT